MLKSIDGRVPLLASGWSPTRPHDMSPQGVGAGGRATGSLGPIHELVVLSKVTWWEYSTSAISASDIMWSSSAIQSNSCWRESKQSRQSWMGCRAADICNRSDFERSANMEESRGTAGSPTEEGPREPSEGWGSRKVMSAFGVGELVSSGEPGAGVRAGKLCVMRERSGVWGGDITMMGGSASVSGTTAMASSKLFAGGPTSMSAADITGDNSEEIDADRETGRERRW